MNNKPRTKVKFQVFEHEDDAEILDFTLELTNFPRKHLFDLLTSIRQTVAKSPSETAPDEAT